MSDITLLDASGSPLNPAVRRAAQGQMLKNRVMASAAYQGASFDHPNFAKWNPGTWSGQSALDWSRGALVDRLNDVARNDGWGAAGTSRLVDNIIGSGWTLASKPNHRSLNISYDEAEEISDQIEGLWRDYTLDVDKWCDAERTKTMAEVMGAAARQRFGAEGEAMAVMVWHENAPLFQTAVHVIDPARCSNPNNRINDEFLRDGVVIDGHGAPQGYHFRRSHPGDIFAGNTGLWNWEYVERHTEWGRPVVIHAFQQKRAGMTRGVSDWAPVMRSIKQSTDYEDYESQAALLNAVMAAFIETPFDPEEMLAAMDQDPGPGAISKLYGEISGAQEAYYKAAPIRLPGVQVNMLQPGEKATLTKPEHPNANFEAFVNAALRKVASAVGITYEQLTMDWSQVNYSSARAALLEIWRGFTAKKGGFASQFKAPIYRCFVEEVFDKRLIRLPSKAVSFEANPAAWCHADWIGPGRGWIDPLKEAQAAGERMKQGLTTLQREAAEQGSDWKLDMEQRAVEVREYQKRGLVHPSLLQSGASAAVATRNADGIEPDEQPARAARRNRIGMPLIGRGM